MTADTYMTAQECLSVASLALAGLFWIRARHLEAREQIARTEVRRLKLWGSFWHQAACTTMAIADAATSEVERLRALPSKRASHARQCQLTQQRARRDAKTAQLRGEG